MRLGVESLSGVWPSDLQNTSAAPPDCIRLLAINGLKDTGNGTTDLELEVLVLVILPDLIVLDTEIVMASASMSDH